MTLNEATLKPKIKIAACRVNAGLTQSEMAEKLGISMYSYLQIEDKKREPTLSQAVTISELSGIPIDFFDL